MAGEQREVGKCQACREDDFIREDGRERVMSSSYGRRRPCVQIGKNETGAQSRSLEIDLAAFSDEFGGQTSSQKGNKHHLFDPYGLMHDLLSPSSPVTEPLNDTPERQSVIYPIK